MKEIDDPEANLRSKAVKTIGFMSDESSSSDEFEILIDKANPTTPKRGKEYDAYEVYVNERLANAIAQKVDITPSVARVSEKRMKAARKFALDAALMEEELHARKAQDMRKVKYSDRHVQKYGVIYADDARLTVMKRNEKEEAEKAAILERKEAAKQKKEKHQAEMASRKASREALRAEKREQQARRAQNEVVDKGAELATVAAQEAEFAALQSQFSIYE